MSGMLASVNSITEARVVLDAGVDIIDIKNPHEGALGALDIASIKNIVQFIDHEVFISATIGDIESDDPELMEYIAKIASTGVDYVKVGLFASSASDYFIETINNAVKTGVKLVVVLFAEDIKDVNSIVPLMQTGITGIMLDTKIKKSENLCEILSKYELQQFIDLAKEYNLLTGLAGSLKFENIVSLLELKPDYLGFRGALCSESDRIKNIKSDKVKMIRQAIPYQNVINSGENQLKQALI